MSDDRWTHCFGEEEAYEQLDYVLLSASFAATSAVVVEVRL